MSGDDRPIIVVAAHSGLTVEGAADHRDGYLTKAERRSGLMTPCVSRAWGDRLILDI